MCALLIHHASCVGLRSDPAGCMPWSARQTAGRTCLPGKLHAWACGRAACFLVLRTTVKHALT